MTAPTYTCWLCGNLGALRPIGAWPANREIAWEAFKATGPINLARDEHVCPACHGSHQPRRTEFPIRLGGGAT